MVATSPSALVRSALALVVMLLGTAAYAQVPVDLSTWTVEGPDLGNWSVSDDGTSVLQTVNQLGPTFFVSPGALFDQSINGSFGVETTSDNDYIGFVFGYQGPLESKVTSRRTSISSSSTGSRAIRPSTASSPPRASPLPARIRA